MWWNSSLFQFSYCNGNTSKKHFLHISRIMCFFPQWHWNKWLNCGSFLNLINVIQGLPQTVCHLFHLLIRSCKVFIFPNLRSHAQDGALLKAGLLANTVNEFSTAKMSMVFYLLRKGLIYLVQLPSVIFMEMSEQQSGEAMAIKMITRGVAKNTPLTNGFYFSHHWEISFRDKATEPAQFSTKANQIFCQEYNYIFEILKHTI